MREPLISVVTVSYNAALTIEQTILSIINQTYKNIEYIIVDGGSTDDTINIIKKYADRIAYWISEPDKGIYDAMNKGINIATGEWINFMNSGDTFYSNGVIGEIVEKTRNKIVDVVYGNTLLQYSWGVFEKKALPLNTMLKHLPFSHQSCLINSDIMKLNKYSLQYKICADYNFFYHLYLEGGNFLYLPMCISIYEAEYGLSSVNVLLLKRELGKIGGKEKCVYWDVYIYIFSLYFRCTKWLKLFLPQSMVVYYHKKRYCKV